MSHKKSRFKYPKFTDAERKKFLEFLDVCNDYAQARVDEETPFAHRDPSVRTMGSVWYYTAMKRCVAYQRSIVKQSGSKRGPRRGKAK